MPTRRAKPEKVDKRTKAFRARHPRAVHLPTSKLVSALDHAAPKPGEAETVLSILALLASYDAEVKKRILVRAGQLA